MLSSPGKWTVGWGVSTICDLKCPFCYSSEVRQLLKNSDFTISQAEQFLSNNEKEIRAINFGTGECFLSPTFPHLLELCHNYVPLAQIAVTTNGAFADLSSAELAIVERYIDECDISLDFAEQELHDHWRGKAGTWRRAIKAIEIALEYGLDTSIVMIGTKQTLNENNIRGLLKLSQKYQIAFRINIYMPTFGDYSFIPSIESVIKTLELLNSWTTSMRSSDLLLGSIIGNNGFDFHSNQSCRILPNGSISPSTYLIKQPWLIDNKLENILLSKLTNTDSFMRYSTPPIPIECEKCPFLLRCKGGSVERRWLWLQSLDMPDPLCPYLNKMDQRVLPIFAKEKQIERWKGPSIHLDYLPTIVALPPSI